MKTSSINMCLFLLLLLCGSALAETLSLPSMTASIDSEAFYGDSSVTAVNIPDGCSTIGPYAFYGCTSLEKVTIPDSVTSIGRDAFSGCDKLVIYCTDDSVAADYAQAMGIRYVTDGFVDEGDYTDDYCDVTWRLTSNGVLIITGTGSIDGYCYKNTRDFKNSTYEEKLGVESYSIPWFNHADEITSIYIGEGIAGLENGAFPSLFKNVTDIHLPNTLSYIRSGGLPLHLTRLTIPDSVTQIDYLNLTYLSISNVRLPAGLKELPCIYTPSERFVVPEGIESIPDEGFSYCRKLTELIMPESLKTIGCNVFSGCENLKRLVIPEGVTVLKKNTFCGSSITELELPEALETIEDGAFSLFPYAQFPLYPEKYSITIPGKVKNLGTPFTYDSLVNGTLQHIEFKEGIEALPDGALADCVALDEVSLPNTLLTIGASAFARCKKLKTIEIPPNVVSIGSKAFQDCVALTDITIPQSVTDIADDAFDGVESVTIHATRGSAAAQLALSQGYTVSYGGDVVDVLYYRGQGNVIHYDGHSYEYVDTPMMWNEAKTWCAHQGGHMLTINSRGEQVIISNWLNDERYNENCWIGLSRSDYNTWITGESVSYTNWRSGQPADNGKDYVIMNDYLSHTWSAWGSDHNAAEKACFICEYEQPSSQPSRYKSLGGHTYEFIQTPMTWSAAKAWCEQHGGHLLTINSESEQSGVHGWLKSSFDFGRIWMGMKATDFTVWITGEHVVYNNWGWGGSEPDGDGDGAQYVAMANYYQSGYLNPGEWDDWGNDATQECFVCEYEDSFTPSETLIPVATKTWEGHKYLLFDAMMAPMQAEMYCRSLGGHLASITSDAENNAIKDIFDQGSVDEYLIGGTDHGSEGQWRWLNGEPWDWTNWYPGGWAGTAEPNNGYYSENDGNDYCVAEINRGWQWVDVYGEWDHWTHRYGFLCEIGEASTHGQIALNLNKRRLNGLQEGDALPTTEYIAQELTLDTVLSGYSYIQIRGDLTIKSGAHVTVRNSKIEITDGNLILRDGAVLDLQNGANVIVSRAARVGEGSDRLTALNLTGSAKLTAGQDTIIAYKGSLSMTGGEIKTKSLSYSANSRQTMSSGRIVVSGLCSINGMFNSTDRHTLKLDGGAFCVRERGATVGSLVIDCGLKDLQWRDGIQDLLTVNNLILTDNALTAMMNTLSDEIGQFESACALAGQRSVSDAVEGEVWMSSTVSGGTTYKSVASAALAQCICDHTEIIYDESNAWRVLKAAIPRLDTSGFPATGLEPEKINFVYNGDKYGIVISSLDLLADRNAIYGSCNVKVTRFLNTSTYKFTTQVSINNRKLKDYVDACCGPMYGALSAALRTAAEGVPAYIDESVARATEIYRFSNEREKSVSVVMANAGAADLSETSRRLVDFFTTGYQSKSDTRTYTAKSQFIDVFKDYFADPAGIDYLAADTKNGVAVKGKVKAGNAIKYLMENQLITVVHSVGGY